MLQSAGELRLSLRYEPPEEEEEDVKKKKKKHHDGKLHVRVLEARDLFYDNSIVKWCVFVCICIVMSVP